MTDFLQLDHVRTTKVEKSADGYVVYAAGAGALHACQSCRSPSMYRHGVVEQTYRDVPSHGQPVTLLVARQRIRCRSCSRTQFDAIPDLDDRRFATRRLVEYIHQESFRRPFSPLAADIGIDQKTVRNVFEDHAEHLRQIIKFETPTWLGIDELKIIGEYHCMITNIEKHAIFDLLPTRRQHDLMPYFRQLPDKD